MTVTERRAKEVARQKRRNIKDAGKIFGCIVCLLLWAAVLAGFVGAAIGGL